MFSDEVTNTDAFLDMPSGSQLLYFHLGMAADDDGFISSPKMIMRAMGASDDELKVLLAKKFLLDMGDGVCVVKHWRINNQIRKDRYTETKYTDKKAMLFIRENGSYTNNPEGAMPVPKGHFLPSNAKEETPALPSGNQVATKGQPSIGKVSIGKGSKDNTAGAVELPEWLDKGKWAEWVQFRKEKKQALKASTIKYQLKLLSQHIPNHAKMIEQSIMQGWTGLFELKGNYKSNAKPANVLNTSHTKTVADRMKEKADKHK